MPLLDIHNPGAPLELTLAGLKLTAFSISAVSTYVLAPELDACFDLGHCPLEATRLRHVFLSHTHQDHCAGAHRHLALRRMYGARPSRFFVPAPSAAPMRELFDAMDRLERNEPADYSEIVRGLEPGDRVKISGRYEVRAFEARHRLPSLGYTVTEARRKLKAAYQGLPGPEIAKARERGEELHDVQHLDLLTYIGDSTIETLLEHPEVGQSQILFLEATHILDTPRETSHGWGHTHLDELVDLARTRPEIFASPHIVLKHFSTRYDRRDIRRAFAALPPWLRAKTTLLIPEEGGRR
jgi:ribonuclease Z